MLPLGTPAPDFDLPEVVRGGRVRLGDFRGSKGLLVIFLCQHCPYVVHVKEELARIGQDYASRGLAIVAISSNDVETYPADSPENLRAMALESGFNFPVAYDESQQVAKAFTAACTPDFFLFDAGLKLVYRGQLDETRPRTGAVATGRDLRAALDALLAGGPISPEQRPSMGCNIKWKPGNQPTY